MSAGISVRTGRVFFNVEYEMGRVTWRRVLMSFRRRRWGCVGVEWRSPGWGQDLQCDIVVLCRHGVAGDLTARGLSRGAAARETGKWKVAIRD